MKERLSILVAVLAALAVLAPTPGDTGGCGTAVVEMSSAGYGNARKLADCARCKECNIGSERCARACNRSVPPEFALPPTCRPLLHDGQVCLRAIYAASCADFATYVDENAPVTPSECGFCQVPPPPADGTFGGVDAGDDGDAADSGEAGR